MARASLTIEKRDASGKSPTARRLRTTGRVPGVIYQPDGENTSFSADNLELAAVLRKGNTLIDVHLDGKEQLTVVKEYQVHPVRGNLVHLDLQAVRMDQMVRSTASLTLVGTPVGLKAGGILTQGLREVSIESTAANIPDTIEYDVTELDAGDVVILKDITFPEGVTALDDEGSMVVAITVPRGAKKRTDEQIASDEAAGIAAPEGEEA
ncbi:MAG: 50S ribosomal protein L25 [Thermoleophilia bacterium]|nr:50S ribosomal protein L25 [Thermoleophilia bacterium]